ncbi:heme-dependent oxidative N-demethylase family protein [Spirosoma koreense]
MLPYFPFGQQFNEKMGTAPLSKSDRLFEVDAHYPAEIVLKRQLLTEWPNYYYRALPGYESAQWDVLELVLQQLAQFAPGQFKLRQAGDRWTWTNQLLHEETTFTFGDATTLAYAPLDWAGRQVQEDLLLLDDTDVRLVAGQLCFGNDWCLDEKLGLPFWQIHAPIAPIVEPMLRAAQQLMARLPAGRSVWRANWSIKINDQLDMTSRHTPALKQMLADRLPTLTPETIGDQLYVRVERQTLTRLPRSGAVLFGIHTYQNLLAHEADDPERATRMAQVFSTTPAAMLAYKSMTPFLSPLLTYLSRRSAGRVADNGLSAG